MSRKSKRNSLVSWVGVLAAAVVVFFYMDQAVQAGGLKNATESAVVVANADSSWHQGALGKKMVLGFQGDFRDPLF